MLHSEGVEVSGSWQGAKGFFSGEGLILLKATGRGDVFFNSYGAILQIDVTDQFIVDTGYIVAFEDTLQYRITVLPGLRMGGKIKSFFFGLAVTLVPCYVGFNTQQGAEGVGRSTTAAVVSSSVLILFLDALIAKVLLQ